MRFEWVLYSSVNREGYIKYQDVLKNIPANIRRELLQEDTRLANYVAVEAHKKEVIEFLDRTFEIGTTRDIKKEHNLEIDQEEIGHFTHFHIGPKNIEVERDFFVEASRPTCYIDGCFVGSEILGPVKMKAVKAKRIEIAQLGRAWGKPVELVISAKLKEIFETRGVTGLSYEPVELLDKDGYDSIQFDLPFLARITNSVYLYADEVVVHTMLCEVHRTTYFRYVENKRIPKESIASDDFLELCGIMVKGQLYNYHINGFIVTRRILEILLDNKVKGLENIGFFMKAKFRPCLLVQ
jgi:hypothetical protein